MARRQSYFVTPSDRWDAFWRYANPVDAKTQKILAYEEGTKAKAQQWQTQNRPTTPSSFAKYWKSQKIKPPYDEDPSRFIYTDEITSEAVTSWYPKFKQHTPRGLEDKLVNLSVLDTSDPTALATLEKDYPLVLQWAQNAEELSGRKAGALYSIVKARTIGKLDLSVRPAGSTRSARYSKDGKLLEIMAVEMTRNVYVSLMSAVVDERWNSRTPTQHSATPNRYAPIYAELPATAQTGGSTPPTRLAERAAEGPDEQFAERAAEGPEEQQDVPVVANASIGRSAAPASALPRIDERQTRAEQTALALARDVNSWASRFYNTSAGGDSRRARRETSANSLRNSIMRAVVQTVQENRLQLSDEEVSASIATAYIELARIPEDVYVAVTKPRLPRGAIGAMWTEYTRYNDRQGEGLPSPLDLQSRRSHTPTRSLRDRGESAVSAAAAPPRPPQHIIDAAARQLRGNAAAQQQFQEAQAAAVARQKKATSIKPVQQQASTVFHTPPFAKQSASADLTFTPSRATPRVRSLIPGAAFGGERPLSAISSGRSSDGESESPRDSSLSELHGQQTAPLSALVKLVATPSTSPGARSEQRRTVLTRTARTEPRKQLSKDFSTGQNDV